MMKMIKLAGVALFLFVLCTVGEKENFVTSRLYAFTPISTPAYNTNGSNVNYFKTVVVAIQTEQANIGIWNGFTRTMTPTFTATPTFTPTATPTVTPTATPTS